MIKRNPISEANIIGILAVVLSPCLIRTSNAGQGWLGQHLAFAFVLGGGLLLTALYVRITIEAGPQISQAIGLWPLVRVRRFEVAKVDDVYADMSYVNGRVYRAYLRWTNPESRPGKLLLAETGPDAVRVAAEVSSLFSVPVKTSRKFESVASDEVKQIVSDANRAIVNRTYRQLI